MEKGGRGDLVISIRIMVQKELTKEEQEYIVSVIMAWIKKHR